MKAMFASRDDGGLKLQDHGVAQARGIREIARRSADGGNQAFVWIHANRDLVRKAGHGYALAARATSHASRQSGQ